ncbi:hypothetical protein QAD02_004548 [Eretmocerus hayati]|uniref:Uncharacterized protein n=1 Tax=Eretmocerus hayati TaxID=131215 RepID=A0ACC2NRQ1_9HYME|nr:hypothetical protein QAD02_004548 [Eretmocerus hayati]
MMLCNFFLILLLKLANFYREISCSHHGMSLVIEKLKNDTSMVPRVNLIVKSDDQGSPNLSALSRCIADELSTTITTYPSYQDPTDQCESNTKIAEMTSKKYDLKIGIVDLQSRANTTYDLMSMLDFIVHQDPLMRVRCMIILVNGANLTYESFFEYSWTRAYLDLSLVEFIRIHEGKKLYSSQITELNHNIYIHVFNPFYKKYSKSIFNPDTQIFPDKVKNLNGYPLRTLGPMNTNESLKISSDYLTDVLSENLNFKPTPYYQSVKIINDINQSNETNLSTDEAMQHGLIDYDTVTEALIIYERDNECSKPSDILHMLKLDTSVGVYVVARQYITPRAEISFSFVTGVGIFFTIVSTFLVFSRLLKFNVRKWTVNRIISTIVGLSNEYRGPKRLSEMVFKMSVYTVSGIVAFYLNDVVINILLGRERTSGLRSFQDLSKANMKISMSTQTKSTLDLFSAENTAIGIILNEAEVYDQNDHSNISSMNDTDDFQHVQLYIAFRDERRRSMDMFYLFESFDNDDRRTTIIVDRISESRTSLILKPTAFFLHSFSKIITKLRESGIIDYWKKWDELRIWGLSTENYVIAEYKNSESMSYKRDQFEIPLHFRLVLILSIGYSIASIILVCEILWKRFEPNVQKSHPLLFKIFFGVDCLKHTMNNDKSLYFNALTVCKNKKKSHLFSTNKNV